MTSTSTDAVADAAAASGGAALEIEGVTKAFGSFVAVDDLSLTVPSGSFFALLGPSGCGKTTTLRMVAGLEQPTSGTLSIGGRDVTGTRAHQRPVNTVFQSYALFPHLTVRENVAFGLKRSRARDIATRVADGLDLVELGHLADRKPAQLSGGQQQRVALARALVNRPALLLLDEPLGALDLKLRRQMQLELKRIQTEVGLTFVHVTHDQEEAMTMADTVAVMNHGRIEQMGSPADLYELPRTAFVANFLGQSNLVAGTVTERLTKRGLLGVDVRGTRILVPSARAVSTEGAVLVGARPEKMRLVVGDQAIGRNENVLGPGTVTDVSFMGVSTQYQVEVPGLGTFGVFAQNLLGGATVTVGSSVRLAWAVDFTFGLDGAQAADEGTVDLDDGPAVSIAAALGDSVASGPDAPVPRRTAQRAHLVLLGPGLLYLVLFFVVPVAALLATSLYVPVPGGDVGQYQPALHWQNYVDALSQFWPTIVRSFWFALLATVAALIIGYPMAYVIAVRARGRKLLQGLLLVLVVAPFFTSFILRTIAWKQILADDAFVVTALHWLHVLPPDARLTATPFAVVSGLTYNFLPFMVLPIFAALERLDSRLLEAGADLYASPTTTFRTVTWPLSMPGVVAGTLLTFIPAAGDYVNASLLGNNTNTTMVGQVIDARFFKVLDYPTAASLSVVLMVAILLLVGAYIRRAGTEDLL